MGDFVVKTFLGTAVDSDGDGVADCMDHCPDTPNKLKLAASQRY